MEKYVTPSKAGTEKVFHILREMDNNIVHHDKNV